MRGSPAYRPRTCCERLPTSSENRSETAPTPFSVPAGRTMAGGSTFAATASERYSARPYCPSMIRRRWRRYWNLRDLAELDGLDVLLETTSLSLEREPHRQQSGERTVDVYPAVPSLVPDAVANLFPFSDGDASRVSRYDLFGGQLLEPGLVAVVWKMAVAGAGGRYP